MQIGHRKSIDIDLFGEISSDSLTLSKRLNEIGKITVLRQTENIHIYIVNDIKVDIVNYSYRWLENSIIVDDIILANKTDIAAMKLAAITGRGTKKDFIDLFFLLHYFSLEEMIELYNKKYYDGSLFLVLKSLSFFDDAERDPNPIMLKSLNWESVKDFIKNTLASYCKKI